jgi:hypothetical protein
MGLNKMTNEQLKTIIKVLKDQNDILSTELLLMQKWNKRLVRDKVALLNTINLLVKNA